MGPLCGTSWSPREMAIFSLCWLCLRAIGSFRVAHVSCLISQNGWHLLPYVEPHQSLPWPCPVVVKSQASCRSLWVPCDAVFLKKLHFRWFGFENSSLITLKPLQHADAPIEVDQTHLPKFRAHWKGIDTTKVPQCGRMEIDRQPLKYAFALIFCIYNAVLSLTASIATLKSTASLPLGLPPDVQN